MKKYLKFIFSFILIISLCLCPALAADVVPYYSIETIEVALDIPFIIPEMNVTTSTGRNVTFPSYQTHCEVLCNVDIDTRNGSIVRVSLKSTGINPNYKYPSGLPDLTTMDVTMAVPFSHDIQISSDKESFTIDLDLSVSVKYTVIWAPTSPPVNSYDETIDWSDHVSATYYTA